MAQNLNIVVRTTAAKSPRSNGLNERHNGDLGEMVKKTFLDTGWNFEVTLSWAVNVKNTPHNSHGYSPNQVVFGRYPNLPPLLVINFLHQKASVLVKLRWITPVLCLLQ